MLFNVELMKRHHILVQLSVELVSVERLGIADDDEFHSCPRDGHVHAPEVGEETDVAAVVGTDKADEDDVALLTLKSVDGVERY